MRALALALALAGLAAVPAAAKVSRIEANKALVLDFFRDVFEAQNAEAAKRYLSEGYVQHNPLVAAGRDGFIAYFKLKWKEPKPAGKTLREPPDQVVAEGDLVTLMWKVPKAEPSDPAKTYDSFWFDMFRVKDGMLVEHWDNATKR